MKDKYFILFCLILLAVGVVGAITTPIIAQDAPPATPLSVKIAPTSTSTPSPAPTPEPQHILLFVGQRASILCGAIADGESAGTLRATSFGSDSWLIECLPPNQ